MSGGGEGHRSQRPALGVLVAFGVAALAVGLARGATTTYLPVLLDRIEDSPTLIGVVMLVNPLAGFAVPLVVGLWSDRIERRQRRKPFLIGGGLVAVGGLLSVGLGTASSYLYLALSGLVVYVGLAAAGTAHRTLVADRFAVDDRPAATSSLEAQKAAGGLLGLVLGGFLVATSASALFVVAAVIVPVLLAVTLLSLRSPQVALRDAHPSNGDDDVSAPARLLEVVRRPGARQVLLAQVLWVLGYVALPTFFIIAAREAFGAGPLTSALVLAGVGALTGGALLLAGRAPKRRVHGLLILGAVLLGVGLPVAALFDDLLVAAIPLAVAGIGFGLVTALGFPFFSRFIPEGESGRYSGVYYSARAVSAAIALPLAGLLVELSGSYRAVLVQGGLALLALLPLARVRRAPSGEPASASEGRDDGHFPSRPPLRRVAAVIPCSAQERLEEVVTETLRFMDEVVVVDDRALERRSTPLRVPGSSRVRILAMGSSGGKGDAVAAGTQALLEGPQPPDGVMVLDCDGQHPPERIPAFLAAAEEADIVVGTRRRHSAAMPAVRRLSNAVTNALLSLRTRRRVPDSQCGMRLFRTRALKRVPFPTGGYEAETVHVRRALAADLTIGWAPIPAIYDGEHSAFRPLRDGRRILGAVLAPSAEDDARQRELADATGWGAVLLMLLAATVIGGLTLVPLLQPLDEALFLAINGPPGGSDLIYDALDPHARNYLLIALVAVVAAGILHRSRRWVLGTALAALIAGVFGDVMLESVYLFYDRPRPEQELPAGEILLSHGRTWVGYEALPSGHVVVTTAMAVIILAVAPRLRWLVWSWVALIAVSRILFGAHFPLDVLTALPLGYASGRLVAHLFRAARLLPPQSRESAAKHGARGPRKQPPGGPAPAAAGAAEVQGGAR